MVKQPEIYNSATADMTYNQVIDLVGTWATSGLIFLCGISSLYLSICVILGTGITIAQYNEGMNRFVNIKEKI